MERRLKSKRRSGRRELRLRCFRTQIEAAARSVTTRHLHVVNIETGEFGSGNAVRDVFALGNREKGNRADWISD